MYFEPYKDEAGEYRWRLKAANGRIVADSGEGYENEEDRDRAIETLKAEAPQAEVKEV